MLDINLFREDKGNNPEIIRESLRRRFSNADIVDEIIKLDKEWRQRQFELESLRKDVKRINKNVAKLKISDGDATKLRRITDENKKLTAVKGVEVKDAWTALKSRLDIVGNLVHDSVPISNDEANNAIARTVGERRLEPNLYNHVKLVEMLDIADLKKGVDAAGGRGFYLKGAGLRLNQALINFALDFLEDRAYEALHTPFFMRKDIMARCAPLAQFDEELYKVTGEGDDKLLIATAEQHLCAYHMDDWIHPTQLPMRYAGYSSCFRREAGAHGRDTHGISRVHQFEKVEQFCITSPNGNDSWDMHEEMIKNSEEFYKVLGIPYQVVSIVSGALNDAAAKKYELEGWFPASQTYRVLVSCSNCTDYQARRLEIRYGQKKCNEQAKQYVHLLNSTLTTTERTICCILENYQREDGVEIPPVLRPYLRNKSFLPFKKKPAAETKGQEDISKRSFVFNSPLSGKQNSALRNRQDKKIWVKKQTVTPPPCPVVEEGSSSTQFSFSSRGSVSSETMGCQQEDRSSVPNDEVKAHVGDKQTHDEQKIHPSAVQEVCEKLRFRGNQCYKDGFFSTAERLYTRGINSIPAHEKSSCCEPLLLCYSNRAASRMSLGRIREAIDDCIMALELDPNFLKVQMRAANCHLVLGETDDAVGYFNNCLASGASICLDRRLSIEAADGLQRAKKVTEYVNLAITLLAEGSDVNRALEVISEAMSVSKFSEKLLEMKAEALYMLQKYEEVIQLCEESLLFAEKNFLKPSVSPADYADGKVEGIVDVKLWRFYMMAKCEFSVGKLEEALDFLQKVEKAGSTTGRFLKIIHASSSLSTVISKLLQCKSMGNEAFRSKKYAEAVDHYTTALSTNTESRPFAAICFCNRAASYQALGQITDAIADCSLAISLNGNYTKAISRRASLYELIRDHGHAANDLRKLIDILEGQQRSNASNGTGETIDRRINDLRRSQNQLSAAEEQAKKEIPLEFYLILGVKKSDTAADIKKAYYKAALKHHPDKAGQFLVRTLRKAIDKSIDEDADRLFKIIGEAYVELSDASKRAQYDLDEEGRAAPNESSSSSSSP